MYTPGSNGSPYDSQAKPCLSRHAGLTGVFSEQLVRFRTVTKVYSICRPVQSIWVSPSWARVPGHLMGARWEPYGWRTFRSSRPSRTERRVRDHELG